MSEKHKSRGYVELVARLGGLQAEIESRLRRAAGVSVLEVGCGYGMALLDLGARYGDRISLHGISKNAAHSDPEFMREIAIRRRGYSEGDLANVPLPTFHHFDVCGAWPLAEESFDVVYSQHSFLWFDDKIKALEEINRVLKTGGVAHLDLQIRRGGNARKNSIVIVDHGRELPFWGHARRYKSLRVHGADRPIRARLRTWLDRRLGKLGRPVRRRPYLELKKTPALDFNLEFCCARDFPGAGRSGRKGVQSVYRFRESGKAADAKDE